MRTEPGPGLPEPNVLASIWHRRLLVVVFAAAFALLGAVVYSAREAHYTAEANVLLADPGRDAAVPARDEVRRVADQVALMKSRRVLARAAQIARERTGVAGIDADYLQRRFAVQATDESNYAVVRVRAGEPDRARAAANAIVEAFRIVAAADLQARYQAALRKLDGLIAQAAAAVPQGDPQAPEVKDARAVLARLDRRRADLRAKAAVSGDAVGLFDPAESAKREGASPQLMGAVSTLVGALIGSAVAAGIGSRRRELLHPDDPEALVGAPPLVDIPNFASERLTSKLPALTAVDSRAAREFAFLASSLGPDQQTRATDDGRRAHERPDPAGPMVAFLGSITGEGATTVAANTAFAAAQAGCRVLALDGDVETCALSQLLLGDDRETADMGEDAGDGDRWDDLEVAAPIRWVMGTRSGGMVALLAPSPAANRADAAVEARRLLAATLAVRSRFDLVVVDVAPILRAADGTALLQQADAVVVVVRHACRAARLRDALNRLERLAVRPAGYVYTFSPSGRREARRRALALAASPRAAERWRRRIPALGRATAGRR